MVDFAELDLNARCLGGLCRVSFECKVFMVDLRNWL